MAPSPFVTPQTPISSRTRSAKEIPASDGGDSDFSSDSLEDISTLFHRTRTRQPPRVAQDVGVRSPRAKRFARALPHTSPLPIIPKHKFDLKTLALDARRDSALQASTRRAREALHDRSALSTPVTGADLARSSHDVLADIASTVDGSGNAHRVLRVVQRADTANQDLRYCFFSSDFEPPAPSEPPREACTGPWGLLAVESDRTREQNIAAGTLYTLVDIQKAMPDAVFRWALEEICRAKSVLVRTELCSLFALCPDQVTRLFAPDVLDKMWADIGVEPVSTEDEEMTLSRAGDDVYKGRDWSHLLSVLLLLQSVASSLPFETTKSAIKTLLRMAVDKMVISNMDVENQFELAITALVDAVPREKWDSLCFETCSLLKKNFSSQRIRANVLLCLPISSYRAHNLRRRLAATFFFNDASVARHPPEDAITLQRFIDYMDRPEFQVGPATDHTELRAAILLLDAAVDDGSVAAALADNDDGGEAEARFNERVDELAARLGDIWRRTNDAGMKLSRTETKTVAEWVQKRVAHTVRTRRYRPRSIFDPPPGEESRMKNNLPRQQEFMKQFFRKKQPALESVQTGDALQVKTGFEADSRPKDVIKDCKEVKLG